MVDLVSRSRTEPDANLERKASSLGWPAFAFAVLQSICTAVIAASGLRFAFGLGSLITSIAISAPAQHLHMDAIRLPMLILSVLGATINLGVLWQVWRLRRRPSANWRIQPVSKRKRRMEGWQFAINILTLLLVTAEMLAHHKLHGYYLWK